MSMPIALLSANHPRIKCISREAKPADRRPRAGQRATRSACLVLKQGPLTRVSALQSGLRVPTARPHPHPAPTPGWPRGGRHFLSPSHLPPPPPRPSWESGLGVRGQLGAWGWKEPLPSPGPDPGADPTGPQPPPSSQNVWQGQSRERK